MFDKSLIGKESEPVVVEVEKGAIRRFAEALGDGNPIYHDEEAARAVGYRGLAAPPTFAAALGFNERFRHALDLAGRPFLHGEQQIELARPVVAGDVITVVSRVADVQEKAGASGPMDILVLEDEGRDGQGALVFKTREVLVLRRS